MGRIVDLADFHDACGAPDSQIHLPLSLEKLHFNWDQSQPPISAHLMALTNVWLPGLGSNQGLQLQRLTCYRYTTGQYQKPGTLGIIGTLSYYSDLKVFRRQGANNRLPVL